MRSQASALPNAIACGLCAALSVGSAMAVEVIPFGSPGHSDTGNWTTNSAGFNEHYQSLPDNGATSTFSFDDLEPGTYHVWANWSAWTNRTSVAQYDVSDGGGTVLRDQRIPNSDAWSHDCLWTHIATAVVVDGDLQVVVSDQDGWGEPGAAAYLMVDAIRLNAHQYNATSLDALVVDDYYGPGFGTSGNWSFDGAPGYLSTYLWQSSAAGVDTATYTFHGLPEGTYNVSAVWPPLSNRSQDAIYMISDGGGAVHVDQRALCNGGVVDDIPWELLREEVTVTDGTLTVTLSDADPVGFLIADAVRISTVPFFVLDSGAFVVDNGAPSLGFTYAGSWSSSSDGYCGDEWYQSSSFGSDSATFAFRSLPSGTYAVSAVWSEQTNRTSAAAYSISDGGGLVVVDQRRPPTGEYDDGVAWQLLHTGVIVSDGTLEISVNDQDMGGFLIVDAVRVRRVVADTNVWHHPDAPGPFTSAWETASNWQCGRVPSFEDSVEIRSTYSAANPIVDASVGQVNDVQLVATAGGTAELTVNAEGALVVNDELRIEASGNSSADVQVDGGMLRSGALVLAAAEASVASVQLSRGLLECDTLSASGSGTATVSIAPGATLLLAGDQTAAVSNWVNAGILMASGGGGTLVWDYDELASGQTAVRVVPHLRPVASDAWVATDALGRTLPGYDECGPPRGGRTVGIFYFTWLGQHSTSGPFDITQLLAADPEAPAWGPAGVFHHWGQPELGYYFSDDEYVLRKHAQMLADAGVDVLVLDGTNAVLYLDVVERLCRVLTDIRSEGRTTPQIAFMLNTRAADTAEGLYARFYAPYKYANLWFHWKGRPLLLAPQGGLSSTVRDFFNIRYCWAWTSGYDTWNFLDHYPQDYGWHDSPSVAEQVSVCVAQHPTTNIGRSFHAGTQPAHDSYGLTGTEHLGLCFAEQWSRALQLDPEFLLITGWNEWVAQRFISDGDISFLGEPLPAGDTFFVDAYTQEYSRDIEPMHGGHTDNYYYQMIDGIRRYKGVDQRALATTKRDICVDGDFSDWENVQPLFLDTTHDTVHRNAAGWDGTYVNTTGRNDFVTLKVAQNASDVAFYAQTRDAITPHTDANWMLLFIDSDQNHSTGWEGYDYAVNLSTPDSATTTLSRCNGGWSWSPVAAVPYTVAGNKIEISIPRGLLGLDESPSMAFDFHWADGIQQTGDIVEFAVHGDSAPNRRFNYRFENGVYAAMFESVGDSEGWLLESGLANGAVSDGLLRCEIVGENARLARYGLASQADANRFLRIRMRHATDGTTAALAWRTAADPVWNQQKRIEFALEPDVTRLHNYDIDVQNHSGWTGTITDLRVMPVADAAAGTLDIDHIAFDTSPVGDADYDGDVDASDLREFSGCMAGPDTTPEPGASCTSASKCIGVCDVDGDDDVDLHDYAEVSVGN